MTHRQFTHINRRLKDIISRALILIIATFVIMPPPGVAAAPQTTESVIDTSKTGSITIHKQRRLCLLRGRPGTRHFRGPGQGVRRWDGAARQSHFQL